MYIEILDGLRSIRMNATVNTYAPMHSTSLGKAILSHLPAEEARIMLDQRPLVKLTPNTITTPAQLERHLAEVRSRGYAVDNEETEEGARCLGSAIGGRHGPIAAISISGPLNWLPFERTPDVAKEIMKACRSISDSSGAGKVAKRASRSPSQRKDDK